MKKIILTALLATSLLAEIVYEYEAKYTTDQFLKDPESAKFRKLHRGVKGIICGEVNSKNSFGGYTGFTRFLAKGDRFFTEKQLGYKVFNGSWDMAKCK